MDRGAWWATVHGVAKSRTQLSNVTFTFHFHALEKEMATHSSVFAWRIPGTGEAGGLPSVGSQSRTRLKWLSRSSSSTVLEKAMAPHSSTLAWKIPWTEELGRLPSMGSHRVGHDWSNLAAATAAAEFCVWSRSRIFWIPLIKNEQTNILLKGNFLIMWFLGQKIQDFSTSGYKAVWGSLENTLFVKFSS